MTDRDVAFTVDTTIKITHVLGAPPETPTNTRDDEE